MVLQGYKISKYLLIDVCGTDVTQATGYIAMLFI